MTDQQITFKWPMATQFTPESFDPTDDSEDWPTAPELYDNGYNLHRERMKYKTGGYYGSFQSDIHLKKDGLYNIILHQQASQLPRCLEFMVLRDTYYPIPDGPNWRPPAYPDVPITPQYSHLYGAHPASSKRP
jgi:hypothetical protein